MGKYYSDDSEQRKQYFDSQFISLAENIARGQGLTLSGFFSGLKNFTSFKKYLETVFSADTSLAQYVAGMSNEEKREFFERSAVQEIVQDNIEGEEESIDEIPAPVLVQQVDKQTRRYFDAKIKGRKTRAYETSFKVKGKQVTRLRAPNGRFASRI